MTRWLQLPVIEPKPKEVEFLQPFRRSVKLSSDQEQFFLAIVRAIIAGNPLPRGSYRTSSNPDVLLEETGVMHLHLVHPGSRELLYLVQYPDHVVMLEISDHLHFRTRPKGEVLTRMHGKRLTAIEERRRLRPVDDD